MSPTTRMLPLFMLLAWACGLLLGGCAGGRPYDDRPDKPEVPMDQCAYDHWTTTGRYPFAHGYGMGVGPWCTDPTNPRSG